MKNNQDTVENINYSNYFFEFQYSLKMNKIGLFTRDFNILGYNNKFRESLEAKELMEELMGDGPRLGLIPRYLKDRSVNDLWDAYEKNELYRIPKKGKKRPTKFVFEITKKISGTNQKEVILSAEFDAIDIQKAALTDIDMRANFKEIVQTIRKYATMRSLTNEAHDTKLTRNNRLSRKLVNLIVDANA